MLHVNLALWSLGGLWPTNDPQISLQLSQKDPQMTPQTGQLFLSTCHCSNRPIKREQPWPQMTRNDPKMIPKWPLNGPQATLKLPKWSLNYPCDGWLVTRDLWKLNFLPKKSDFFGFQPFEFAAQYLIVVVVVHIDCRGTSFNRWFQRWTNKYRCSPAANLAVQYFYLESTPV